MNDILLIQPPIGLPELYNKPEKELDSKSYAIKTKCTRVPQNLLSLATVLDDLNYKVDIFDCRLYYSNGRENYIKILKERIKNTNLLIGISVTTPYITQTVEIINLIKEVNSNVYIVVGGIHPTLFPKQTCKDKDIDFVISGDGEYPLCELVTALEEKKSYNKIKGLTYKKNNQVITNPLGEPFNIRKSPIPAYHLFDMEKYLPWTPYYSEKKTIGLDYLTTRGCPFKCSFCVNDILPQNRGWRSKTSNQVIEELSILKEKYKFDYVYFEDDNAFLNKEHSLDVSKRLIKDDFNINYLATIRIDTLLNTPKSYLETFKKSGWSETILGVESGSDKILKVLNKGITIEQSLKSIKILKDLDIWTAYNFMTCIPGEQHKERQETYNLMRKTKKIHPKSLIVGPHLFRPFPGSKLYPQCIKGGLDEPKTFREWSDTPLYISGDVSNLPWIKDYLPIEKYESYIKIYGLTPLIKKAIGSLYWNLLTSRRSSNTEW